jgi:hypothetical protein
MDRTTKIQVWLSGAEWEALRHQAEQQLRHPREQARAILRSVLLCAQSPVCTNENTGAIDRQATGTGVQSINPTCCPENQNCQC